MFYQIQKTSTGARINIWHCRTIDSSLLEMFADKLMDDTPIYLAIASRVKTISIEQTNE